MDITKSLLIEELIDNKLSIKNFAIKYNIKARYVGYVIKKFNMTKQLSNFRSQQAIERYKSEENKKYGKCLIKEYISVDRAYKPNYKCICDCGNICIVNIVTLKKSPLVSCGCETKNINSKSHWKGHSEISGTYFSSLLRGAKSRKLEFNISIEYIWSLFLQQHKKCKLSGIELSFARKDGDRKIKMTASLDRIDSSKGYIEGNIQWIHKDLQKMKWDFNESYYKLMCHLVAQNNPL